MLRDEVRSIVCDSIRDALAVCDASLGAFVLMPTHLHLLTCLQRPDSLHRFSKEWRGKSGRRIVRLLELRGDTETLAILARHENGGSRYAVWKEQARALPIVGVVKCRDKVRYIHENPLRRGLADSPGEWPWSSWMFYETGVPSILPVTPLEIRFRG